jgi:peptide chain release factor 1
MIEIKSAVGGAESALFAEDLLAMYLGFSSRKGWKTQIMDKSTIEGGGIREVLLQVGTHGKAKLSDEEEIGPFGWLKGEGGVHRVQRVPQTEKMGRVHTSTCAVLVSLMFTRKLSFPFDASNVCFDVGIPVTR